VSPQGGRQTSKKGGGGSAAGPAATRRLGLLIFGAAFVVLFAIVAISVGVGNPSVPSGDVALVEDTPGDVGELTQEEFDHALELAANQAQEKVPKPGDPKYAELKETALNALFEAIWLQGIAAEEGIEVTDEELARERTKLTNESFQTPREFREFTKESGFTQADIDERVRLQILSTKLQERLTEKAPEPTQTEIEDYYEAAKDTQFTQQPSVDVRRIDNVSRKKAEEAQEALSKDNSAKNWSKVARQYSEDPATRESGGLQRGVREGVLEEPLDAEVFDAPEGQIEGPVKTSTGYTVFQVENATSETVQSLKAVESQIKTTMAQQAEQEYFTSFISTFANTWTGRTFCADGYVTERCSNFKGNGRPAATPPACYEEDPKNGLPEACPAPVSQLVPALPGTVTPLEPRGTPLPQRPRPKEEEGAATRETPTLPGSPPGEGGPPIEEAPPGGAPPAEGAPPIEEAPPGGGAPPAEESE
jgi:foldase protein PrsA